MYKEVIPKKRNFSMNKIDFKVDENIINNLNNRSFIDYSSSPKSNNTNNNNIKSNEEIINNENTNIINQNKVVNNEKNDEEIDNKLMKTGRFVDLDFIKNNEEIDELKNFMDENICYRETKENPIISKTEKIEGNSVVTTIITRTKKIYTPDEEKSDISLNNIFKGNNQNQMNENVININDFEYLMNDSKSINTTKINNYVNTINSKDLSLKKNLEDNKNSCKTPNQKQLNINRNYINDLKLYSANSHNNGKIEKKYIKDPEGNLVETFVKKTKYKNGSVLLEYV